MIFSQQTIKITKLISTVWRKKKNQPNNQPGSFLLANFNLVFKYEKINKFGNEKKKTKPQFQMKNKTEKMKFNLFLWENKSKCKKTRKILNTKSTLQQLPIQVTYLEEV